LSRITAKFAGYVGKDALLPFVLAAAIGLMHNP
jgi:hypothetical protein